MRKLATLILTTSACWGSAHSHTIDVAVLDFCPYACESAKDSDKQGFVLDLEKAIFEKEGHTVNFHIVPYPRSLRGTEAGEYDAVGLSNDSSSEVNICSTESVGPMIYTFYVKRGNPWRYTGIESVEGITLGTISGYNYTQIMPDFQKYIETNRDNKRYVQVHHGTGDLVYRMFKKIELGRMDTFSEASYVADYVIQNHGLSDSFEKAGSFANVLWGRMCFSPQNPKANEYVDLVDRGIRKMRASGELKAIMQKYGLEVWDPEP